MLTLLLVVRVSSCVTCDAEPLRTPSLHCGEWMAEEPSHARQEDSLVIPWADTAIGLRLPHDGWNVGFLNLERAYAWQRY